MNAYYASPEGHRSFHLLMLRICIVFLVVAFMVLMLTSCATVTTTYRAADGSSTTTNIWELGRTEAITGLTDTISKDGRNISLNSLKSDVNVPALQAGSNAIGTIVGAALKAYTGKP